MTDIDQIASKLRAEAAIDFVELPLITGAVEFELGIKDPQKIRNHTREIIRRLMALDVYPGDSRTAGSLALMTAFTGWGSNRSVKRTRLQSSNCLRHSAR